MNILALDIGGTNIKAAHSQGNTWMMPFTLCREPDKLIDRLRALVQQSPPFDRLAITTTAELCDCFPTKRLGIYHVLDASKTVANDRPIGVWATSGRFVDPDTAMEQPFKVAAANWHALATFVATQYPQGTSVLADCGSTTTDIVLLRAGRPQPIGLTDMDRLASGELVYLGARHTTLSSLGPMIGWNHNTYGLMAEPFSTTGDVFLLTGRLSEDGNDTDTPDGQPMLRGYCAARLVRMIGADLDMLTMDDAKYLARAFEQIVYRRLAQTMTALLSDQVPDRVVISGSGDFVVSTAAQLAWPTVPQVKWVDQIGREASDAACAYALAHLANDHTELYWNPV